MGRSETWRITIDGWRFGIRWSRTDGFHYECRLVTEHVKTPVGQYDDHACYKGLEYGRRYDFTLNLNAPLEGGAGNAGEYNLIEW